MMLQTRRMHLGSGQTILFLIAGFIIYFLPSFIAAQRNHRNKNGVCVLNIFLGWTLVGWVVALIWAMWNDRKPQ